MVFKSNYPDVIPDEKYKDLVSNFFWSQLDVFGDRILFVNYDSRREWTGAQIKTTSARIAINLMKHGLQTNDNSVMFYKHCDYAQVVALGVLFAGGSVCAGHPHNPEREHEYMLEAMLPKFVLTHHALVPEMLKLKRAKNRHYTIIIMDDDLLGQEDYDQLLEDSATGHSRQSNSPSAPRWPILGLHHDLLMDEQEQSERETIATPLPIQVDPNQAAFVLITSGSTGLPKPVCRSQRNCLYVSHSLCGASEELWRLDESSVFSAHMMLDHGTGIFVLKQCLTHGFKSIIINGFSELALLEAIEKYQITDLLLGSAFMHNLLTSKPVSNANNAALARGQLSSLRNLMAVGSTIPSQAAVNRFMDLVPTCSVRPTFGMSECGFLFMVPRELALTNRELPPEIVGCALPNVEFKLINRQKVIDATSGEISENGSEIVSVDKRGELYVRGPTISPGYAGAHFREQARASFLPDGFYKSSDVCSLGSDGLLRIYGRYNDVLHLSDGGKVLPAEIEHSIMEHPDIVEAAVVGVPHPNFVTLHAARAYVVAQPGVEVVEDEDGECGGCSRAVGQEASQSAANNGEANNGGGRATRRIISKRMVFDFVAERLCEPKHLIGGIKFVRELPKISVGKVDRRLLKMSDGY